MGEFVSALGNPWMPDEFNVTRQGEFFLRYGARRAEQFAELARKAQLAMPQPDVKTFILNKKIGVTVTGGGGGGGGGGSAGDGPPA